MGSKNKTIWIFNQYAIKPEFPGGTRHYDLGKELSLKGYNVHIFSGGFHYLMLKELIIEENEKRKIEQIAGINFHWLRVLPYKKNGIRRFLSMIQFYFTLLKEVNRLEKEINFQPPDIIIGSAVHLFTVLAAYNASKKFNARFIMEVRDLWPYTMVATGQFSPNHPLVILFRKMERFLYKKAELIISLLENAHEYIGQYTNPDKVIWIPNSFSKDNLQVLDHCEEINITMDPENLTILFAGSMNELDGVLMLLKAYEKVIMKIEKINLILIGNGMGKPEIENYKLEHKLNNVVILPSIPKNKILCYLKCADILWVGMPESDLYKYGISFNKLYDYMAVSKPILISSSKYGNIVREAQCGIISRADDVDDLTEKIIEFVDMGQVKRNQLGINGFNYLMSHFTTDIIARKLIDEVIEREITK